MTEDEKTYLFQAKLLALGRLSIPMPPGAEAFWQPFIVMHDERWSGQYFWAQSALLVAASVVHFPWLVSGVEVGVTVLFTGLLVQEISGDRRAACAAAVVCAMSPMVLLTGATLHNANLAASLWSGLALGPGEASPGARSPRGRGARLVDRCGLAQPAP